MFLNNTDQSQIKYILKANSLILTVGIALVFFINLFFEQPRIPNYGFGVFSFLMTVVIAPIFETFIMVLGLILLKKILKGNVKISLLNAFIWALLHAYFIPIQGLLIFFTFFVFSYSFLVWDKISRKKAISVAMILHFVNNIIVYSYIQVILTDEIVDNHNFILASNVVSSYASSTKPYLPIRYEDSTLSDIRSKGNELTVTFTQNKDSGLVLTHLLEKIDSNSLGFLCPKNTLFGSVLDKQYINVEIEVADKFGETIEQKKFDFDGCP